MKEPEQDQNPGKTSEIQTAEEQQRAINEAISTRAKRTQPAFSKKINQANRANTYRRITPPQPPKYMTDARENKKVLDQVQKARRLIEQEERQKEIDAARKKLNDDLQAAAERGRAKT